MERWLYKVIFYGSTSPDDVFIPVTHRFLQPPDFKMAGELLTTDF
jgi:hypothetical protein